MNNLEHEKWVRVYLRASTFSKEILEKNKFQLSKYAEEIGWDVYLEESQHEGRKMYTFNISPKGNLSPKEIELKIGLLKGIAGAILKDMICLGNEANAQKKIYCDHLIIKENKKDIIWLRFLDVFYILSDLKKAIRLEIKNPTLFKKVFITSLIDWYKDNLEKMNLSTLKEDKEDAKRIVIILEKNGMPKIKHN